MPNVRQVTSVVDQLRSETTAFPVMKSRATHVVSRPVQASSDVPVRFKVGLLWTMPTPAKCFCHHLERCWMFVNAMHVFLRAYKRPLLLSIFTFEPIPFINPSCALMLSFAYSLRLLCSSCCPILRHFSYHLTVASALVA